MEQETGGEYAVMVEGENCQMEMDGREHRAGFFTWRCVRANGPTEAELRAVQMVQEEIADFARNAPDDPPRLRVKKIREEWGDLAPPGSGFTFFAEDDADGGGKPSFWQRLLRRPVRVRPLPPAS